MRFHRLALILVIISGLAGCQSSPTLPREPQILSPGAPAEVSPTQALSSTHPLLTPAMEENTPMPPLTPTPGNSSQTPTVPPGLQARIDQAMADLAGRLSIRQAEIRIVQAGEVVWPDSSLGCPQKGMAYAQLLTSGYLIILEYNGRQYEYHAGGGGVVFYCPNPAPPVPGAPGNT